LTKKPTNSEKQLFVLQVNEDLASDKCQVEHKSNATSANRTESSDCIHKTEIAEIKPSNVSLLMLCKSYLGGKDPSIYLISAKSFLETSIAKKYFEWEGDHLNLFKIKKIDEFIDESEKKNYFDAKETFCLVLYFLKKEQESANVFSSLEEAKQDNVYSRFIQLVTDSGVSDNVLNQQVISLSANIIKHNVDYPCAYFYQGKHLLKEKKYADAAVYIKKYIDKEKNAYSAWEYLGECYKYLERYLDAVDVYRASLVLESNSSTSLYGLGYCLLQLGRFTEAKKVFERTLELSNNCGSTKKWIFVLSMLNGDFSYERDAINLLDNEFKKTALKWCIDLAKIYNKQDVALRALSYLEEINKNNPDLYLERTQGLPDVVIDLSALSGGTSGNSKQVFITTVSDVSIPNTSITAIYVALLFILILMPMSGLSAPDDAEYVF
jgi:tetratricopeptide (TPR) repeat protein